MAVPKYLGGFTVVNGDVQSVVVKQVYTDLHPKYDYEMDLPTAADTNNGLLAFVDKTSQLFRSNGTAWQPIGSGSGGVTSVEGDSTTAGIELTASPSTGDVVVSVEVTDGEAFRNAIGVIDSPAFRAEIGAAAAVHTHTSSSITDFTEAAQDAVGAALTDTSSIDLTYTDGANTISAAAIFGTTSGTVCQGNDSRLSDARTPTSHTQAWSTITSTPTTLSGYGITDALSNASGAANRVMATPNGSTGSPSLRALVAADLPTSGVSAASQGSASSVATYTVDVYGRLTAGGSTAIAIDAAAVTSGTFGVARGGTSFSTYTLGDLIYCSATNTLAKLAGNTTTARQFLGQTGTGSVSAAPSWAALTFADMPVTTDVSAYLSGSNQALTMGVWNTIQFNTETVDAANEFNTSTYAFTPGTTGLYDVEVGVTHGGLTGRSIVAVFVSTTEFARTSDGNVILGLGRRQLNLTGGTAYLFKSYGTMMGVSASAGAELTFLRIRRLK